MTGVVKQMLEYIAFRICVVFFSILPWCAVYKISQAMAWLLRRVIKYRLPMLHDHIHSCFPEYTQVEKKHLIRSIYNQYTDVICENMKSFSMSADKVLKHVHFENRQLLKQTLDQYPSCLIIASHFCNWEWGGVMALLFPKQINCIYKPVHNRYINRYILSLRRRWDTVLLSTREFPKMLARRSRKSHLSEVSQGFVLLSDQNPVSNQASIEILFLNRPTRFLVMPEKMAKRFNAPMIYAQMTRSSRGQYRVRFLPLEGESHKEGDLTRMAAKYLEHQILEDPSSWLWLHNRWKVRH